MRPLTPWQALDWFDRTPRWHPQYRVWPIPGGADWLLASPGHAHRLSDTASHWVADLVAQRQTPAAYCRQMHHIERLPALLHTLTQMTRMGWVCDAADVPDADWYVPDFSVPATHHVQPDGTQVVLLTPQLRLSDVLPLALELRNASPGLPPALVLCDDYGDPRLAQWAQAFAQTGQTWLPIQATGTQPQWGPVVGGEGNGPCWHCISQRWWRNQPVATALRRWLPQTQAVYPVRCDTALAKACLQRLLPSVLDMLQSKTATMWVASNESTAVAHLAVRRPQCPQCGDGQYVAKQAWSPIRPGPAPKVQGAHGGARTQALTQVLPRLDAAVGAVLGAVVDVVPLGRASDTGLPVYTSRFMRPLESAGHELQSNYVQNCLGKGMTAAQSRASALGEALERYAACYQGDEAVVVQPAAQLPAPAIMPRDLVFFSPLQQGQPTGTHVASHKPRRTTLEPCAADTPLAWVPAWSLTHDAQRFVPLGFCYANAPAPWSDYCGWTSNGCASGSVLEEALLQGLLEVIERDATAIWWYSELERPAVLPGHTSPQALALVQASLGDGWQHWLLDITHDMAVPVVAAVGRHQATGRWALGFGCSLDIAMACERALTELVQLVVADKCLPADWNGLRGTDPLFLYPCPSAVPAPVPCGKPHPDIAQDLAVVVAALARCGLEVVAHDYSRPDLPLRTVKVIVPGACHIWPELDNPRLRDVPVALGWRQTPKMVQDFNPWPLYV